MSGLRFELLGQPRVLRDGAELDIGPGKQRAVLAVLLLHANRPVPTTTIVDAVWPDDPPANGPNVVQKHVAGLRKILEPERTPRAPGKLLTRTDAGYQLTVDLEAFDVAEFHAYIARARTESDASAVDTLRAAIALWHGSALAGLDGTVFDVERTRFDEARANAVEERIDRELRQGLHGQVVPELFALTAQHPYRERLRGQLMLALYRSGRQADALAAFRDGRRLLNEELGIEPGDALRSLHDQILAAAPSLAPTPDRGAPTRPDPSPPGAAPNPPYQQGPAVQEGPPLKEDAPPQQGSPRQAPPQQPFWQTPPHQAAPSDQIPTPPQQQPPPYQPPPSQPPPSQPPRYQPPPYQPPPYQAPPYQAPPPPPGNQRARRSGRRALTGWWLVVGPLLSIGMLTWAAFLAASIKLRGRWLWLSTVVYAVIVVFAFILKDITTVTLIMLVPWFVGTAHGWFLRPRLRGLNDPIVAEARANQARRAEARRLAATNPGLARDLRIGRPDLIRDYDDGGLVDVNAVPEEVLCDVAGLSKEQAVRIVGDRDLVGGFSSVDDLVNRGLLDRLAAEAVRDRLLFLR